MPLKTLSLLLATLSLLLIVAAAAEGSPDTTTTPVWEVTLPPGNTQQTARYAEPVERLLKAYEAQIGRELTPGEKGKVGLKLYAESGPGLATPHGLVSALIEALARRGYDRENIFLVGLNAWHLREAGFLPHSSRLAAPYAGHPIYVLESGRYFEEGWFYDSPLPARFEPILAARDDEPKPLGKSGEITYLVPSEAADAAAERRARLDADRKSFLATPLFLDADFWINLPAYSDHPALGVNGALVNATLWNASNTSRFLRSTRSAPAAVAEMAAIPELRETWAFSLVSLERWQFIGGPEFNSLYTRGEPLLWLGGDPVAMDALMRARLNQARLAVGFAAISEEIRTLEFAALLGVGQITPSLAPVRIDP
jgi:hypothetical protein